MKNLLIILLFIPLIAFGQEVKKVYLITTKSGKVIKSKNYRINEDKGVVDIQQLDGKFIRFKTFNIASYVLLEDEKLPTTPTPKSSVFYDNYAKKDVFKNYNADVEANPDLNWKILETSKNKFQYSWKASYFKPTVYTFHFNDDGKVVLEEVLRHERRNNGQTLFNEEKFKYDQYDSNPVVLKEKGVFMNTPIIETIRYKISYYAQNTNVDLSYCKIPYYNKRGNKIKGYTKGILIRKYPQQSSKGISILTKVANIDLKSEDMIYDIKNYVYFFLEQVENPSLYLLSHFMNDAWYDAQNPKSYENRSADNKWYINYDDRHRIQKYQSFHKKICETNFGDKTDKKGHNQIVCAANFTPKEIKIEYRNLDDDAIAMAIGNIFDDDKIHIVIDSRKFKNASPAKRAFVMWHELYHSFGLEHGECGPLMFPYTKKDYSWSEWESASIEAVKCFNKKRNFGKKVFVRGRKTN